MSRIISVDPGLQAVSDHLQENGYDVVSMAECVRPIEAVVYQGPRLSSPSVQRAARGTALVNAAGLTAEEVSAQLENRLG